MQNSELKKQIFHIVSKIPDGKVMYFGQIADLVGTTARIVGFILTGMNSDEMKIIPWYRVIAKNGYISSLKLGEKGLFQKQKLLAENYTFTDEETIDINKHLWLFAGLNVPEDNSKQEEDYKVWVEELKVKGIKPSDA